MEEGTIAAVVKQLFPLCTIVTPNLAEAEKLTTRPAATRREREEAARAIHTMGAGSILLKGGHLAGEAEDLLYDGDTFTAFSAPRIFTPNTHGTGCTLSSALVCGLIAGKSQKEAAAAAKTYVTHAIAASPGLGRGSGPLNHLFAYDTQKKGDKP
jgi:hydroxymethylpyrimidine/phosphomethylpyrimidine kinase